MFQAPIYDGMTFDFQNDKEFAISGSRSRELMSCARLTKPAITKSEIKNYRDEFDPLFQNSRKGWHKRPMRDYCKKILEDFGDCPKKISQAS